MRTLLILGWFTLTSLTVGSIGRAQDQEGGRRIVDLTHSFDRGTIYWPTETGFQLIRGKAGVTERGYYYAANRFTSAEHGGTHLDAPIHFYKDRHTVDQIPLKKLVGEAVVIDVTKACASDQDYQIGVGDILSYLHDCLPSCYPHNIGCFQMVRQSASNAFEEDLLANIRRFGWHCNAVVGQDSGHTFVYTIGLDESFGHPELIVLGMALQQAHSVLKEIVERAVDGSARDPATNIAVEAGDPWVYLPVVRTSYDDYVLSALWFYEDREFPLFQLVWPDSEGRYPWAHEADRDFSESQPVLGKQDDPRGFFPVLLDEGA